jgi:hypothetical protein
LQAQPFLIEAELESRLQEKECGSGNVEDLAAQEGFGDIHFVCSLEAFP